MKTCCWLTALMFSYYLADAQLDSCRPKISLIDYHYHNDNFTNTDMTTIQSLRPDILIDNTPGGYWGQMNSGTGCLPLYYTPLGIQVYSYITGGYEGTEYGTTEDNLGSNLSRVDAIASDSATGVFLDEVSNYPNSAHKAYISSIHNECQAKGLKLIINPGTNNFDSSLMSLCDYVMTDEHYNGTRPPTSSESPFLSRVLVVAQGTTSAANAATITLGARTNGFGYSYACDLYTTLPVWLSTYMTLITQPPTTPTITSSGNILQSSAPTGNQWYEIPSGIIAGATNQTYMPLSPGNYYDIVTLENCGSDTSNIVNVITIPSGTSSVKNNKTIRLYPNPVQNELIVENAENCSIGIYNLAGEQVYSDFLAKNRELINISSLSIGVYFIELRNNSGERLIKKVVK